MKAISEDLGTLKLNDTCDLVPRPTNRKFMGSRWVFKVKHKANGDVEKLKVKLVAKGHTQIEGFGYIKHSP